MRTTYSYPALFTKEKSGEIIVTFPDFHGEKVICENIVEAQNEARELLCFILLDLEQANKPAPDPMELQRIKVEEGQYVLRITCDTLEYRKKHNSKAIARSVSLPKWLNDEVNKRNIHCSAVLREALIKQIESM